MTQPSTNERPAPALNDSVFIGFITNGDGKLSKGGAYYPFDKVQAVYSEKETTKDGKLMHRVRVMSGDVVDVIACSKSYWHAVK